MTQVLVLGAHGMLGSMVARVLANQPGIEVVTASRSHEPALPGRCRHLLFDAATDPLDRFLAEVDCEWIVNAIGVIKPRIDEGSPASVENAIAINSLFPFRLANATSSSGQRVIQIATDCVFSGVHGAYDELEAHDPLDVYGKTKSLGEVKASHVIHLRCSIVGPEQGAASSLLGWILSAAPAATLQGFTNHRWNGVTTLHFARLCTAIINGAETAELQHVVPGDTVTKAELLELVLSAFGRDDVTVTPGEAPQAIDRTLVTVTPQANAMLWNAAGYEDPPRISEMLQELASAAADHSRTP